METLWAPWRHGYITGQGGGGGRKGVPATLEGWPGPDTGCVFCNMLGAVRWATRGGMDAGEAERAAGILQMGESAFVCLNAFPYNSGHLMIVPFDHVATLAELPPSTAGQMMVTAQRMEHSLRDIYRPDGLNFGANIGEAAGAGIAQHLHLHMVPRWAGDTNFITVLGETRVLPESLEVTWKRLREALSPGATRAGDMVSNIL